MFRISFLQSSHLQLGNYNESRTCRSVEDVLKMETRDITNLS